MLHIPDLGSVTCRGRGGSERWGGVYLSMLKVQGSGDPVTSYHILPKKRYRAN